MIMFSDVGCVVFFGGQTDFGQNSKALLVKFSGGPGTLKTGSPILYFNSEQ